jgi:hypothetical protein
MSQVIFLHTGTLWTIGGREPRRIQKVDLGKHRQEIIPRAFLYSAICTPYYSFVFHKYNTLFTNFYKINRLVRNDA